MRCCHSGSSSAASANRHCRGKDGRAACRNRLCVLRFILLLNNPAATLLLILVMVLLPRARWRPDRNAGSRTIQISSSGLSASALPRFHVDPCVDHGDPAAALVRSALCDPAGGIILGNVLNSASLSLDSFLGSGPARAPSHRSPTGRSATAIAKPSRRWCARAIRRGLLPIINQMSAAGIVTLPGIMTGQILAGLDPLEAVKYQILLMFLLSGGSGLSALSASYLAAWRLTDDRQRLRLDRLQ